MNTGKSWSYFSRVKNFHVHLINTSAHSYLFLLKILYIHTSANVCGVIFLYKFIIKFTLFCTWKMEYF